MFLSANGYEIKVGKRVKIVGLLFKESIVHYAPPMKLMLNNNKVYVVDGTIYILKGPVAKVAGWSWDPRNIFVIPEEGDKCFIKETHENKVFNFDVKTLDL